MTTTRPRLRDWMLVVGGLSLVGSLLSATPALASITEIRNHELPVPGHHAPMLGDRGKPRSSISAPVTSTVADGASVAVTQPSTSKTTDASATNTTAWKSVGTSAIKVAPGAVVPAAQDSQTPVTSATVRLLSRAQARAHGLSGLVLEVQRTDGGTKSGPLAIKIPRSFLNGLYGADYASRVRWVQVAAPSGADTAVPSKTLMNAAAVPEKTDAANNSVTLTPQASHTTTFMTASSAPVSSTGTGSFAATSLKSSASWDVSAQTGDFAWSYSMRTPPAAAGPAPALSVEYDSQSVDGETGSSNNQPSSIGDGWQLGGGGFIERTYVSCSEDDGSSGPVSSSGDLCWKTDNATLNLAGHSGQLIKDATTGVWKLQNDDGTRIQHLVGTSQGCAANGTYDTDCWRITTTDGTQYYFGLNELPGWVSGNPVTNSTWTVPVYGNDAGEPCHAATFAASSCTQAWRWNLDYVVDVKKNAEALYYDAQNNIYSADGTTATTYTRGGELDHIDYGIVNNAPYATNAASDRVVFGYDPYGRCSDSTHADCTAEGASGMVQVPAQPAFYPDVPFDQDCTSGTCSGLDSPTFFSTSMLDTVTTEVFTGSAYSNVDVWTLGHSFPPPGDGTSAALWLTQIGHSGYSGSSSIAEPPTVFSGTTMQNRVWTVNGLAPLDKWRIASIETDTGGTISVNYSAQQCTPSQAASIEASPQTNTERCFPEWWTPQTVNPQAPEEDLFHKYVVTSVISNPETGGGNDQTQETDYVYTGTPGWRYDTSPLTPDNQRTWSIYQGYNTVEVRVGSSSTPSQQQTTDYTFYQGMNGDRATSTGGTKSVDVTGTSIPDNYAFAGTVYEAKVLNGVGGAMVSDTITTPTLIATTANDGTRQANMVANATVAVSKPLSTGGTVTTTATTTYDSTYGLPQTVEMDTSDGSGSTCTLNTYTGPNTTAWIIGLVAESRKVGSTCANAQNAAYAGYPSAGISDVRNFFDGATSSTTVPTTGEITSTQQVIGYTGTTNATAQWSPASTATYDALGRVAQRTDTLGHTTTTTYTPASQGPLTSESVQNPMGWTTTTAYNPAWGVETSGTDQNGNITTATYDALGRRTGEWLPNRPYASNTSSPSVGYAYGLSQSAPSTVTTTKLEASGTSTSIQLYDGLDQLVQTQSTGVGGMVATDNGYDSDGRVFMVNNPYLTTQSTPSTTLFVPTNEQSIPSETVTTFDGIGRTLTSDLYTTGTLERATSDSYPGTDRVDMTPPAGGTPTTTITNARGEKTQLIQYRAATPTGSATVTTNYAYDPSGHMVTMTDQDGNAWHYSYDPLGDVLSQSTPDTGATSNTYDSEGELLTSTDARSSETFYVYDSLGRPTAEYAGSSSAGALLKSWAYDSDAGAKGQLVSSTSYVGSTPGTPGAAYTESAGGYNSLYEPTSSTVSIPTAAPALGGTSYTSSFTYKQDGALATQTDPAEGGISAETYTYTYDNLDDITSYSGAATYLTSIAYSGIGQPTAYNRNVGVAYTDSEYAYDPGTGEITGIGDYLDINGTSSVGAARAYTRDANGDITEAQKTATGVTTDTQCYSYDNLDYLTAAWTPSSNSCSTVPSQSSLGGPAPYWDTYTIDDVTGNRTASTETTSSTSEADTYQYSPAHPHAVSSVSRTISGTTTTASYGYDASGDTTSRPGQNLAYDANGKFSTDTVGTATQSNVYDTSGNLLLQSDPTAGTTIYLGDTELHVATGATTASATRTYTVNGTPIAERTTAVGVSGSLVYWLCTDIDGNVDMEIRATTGAITRRYFDPYGNSRGTGVSWSDTHTFLNDPTSALTQITIIGARPYDPTLGSFLSADPIVDPSDPQQINGYHYANSTPITDTDPSGQFASSLAVGNGGQAVSSQTGNQTAQAPGQSNSESTLILLTPHIAVNQCFPGVAKLERSFLAFAKKNGYTASDAARVTAGQEFTVWDAFCAGQGSNYCGSQNTLHFLGVLQSRFVVGNTTTVYQLGIANGSTYLGLAGFGRSPASLSDVSMDFLSPQYEEDFQPIDTPREVAHQEYSVDALKARVAVRDGATVYRGGRYGSSKPPEEAQFFSLEDPNADGYGARYGIPEANLPFDYVVKGTIRSGAPFITRSAPAVGANEGGGIEVVINPGDFVPDGENG